MGSMVAMGVFPMLATALGEALVGRSISRVIYSLVLRTGTGGGRTPALAEANRLNLMKALHLMKAVTFLKLQRY